MLYQMKNLHGGDIYGEESRLDFSANTNPFGTPQGVLEAVQEALAQMYQYPDPYCCKLVQAISDFERLPKAYILCGNGAAELIYAYCTAVKPKQAMELIPTFSEYALALALERMGCSVRRYVLRQETAFGLDEGFLDYLKETIPDVVFLCSPNNPTGQTIGSALMKKIVFFSGNKRFACLWMSAFWIYPRKKKS